uniref:phosphatidate phosphatase n=1 Tax=Scleropages formosus TaxID=113540 RepID=A0A8C9SNE3_SCLFO
MNYVGQLAGQVFVQVKELYRGLNPATLSGCIDVIVVRQPDGTLQCSPFHVRFGKMGVLRSREKLVDIEINGEPVSLHMKLGENGEAFFVKETENDQEVVPSYLATSPIISEGVALMGAQLGKGLTRLSDGGAVGPSIQTMGQLQGAGDNGSMKKRRKRRRKCKVDSVKREDNEDNSEDEDLFPIDMSSDEEKELDGSRWVHGGQFLHERQESQSRHLGADGVYLDDITEMEPEVAALYFPKSDGASAPKGTSENVVRSTSMSPQSIGSSGVDSGVDSFSDQLGDLPSIAISLCGGLTDNKEITKGVLKLFFHQRRTHTKCPQPLVPGRCFLCPSLSCRYYNWSTAAPLMLAMQAFQKPLPKATVENIMKEKMPKKGGRWWFSWRGRNSSIKSVGTVASAKLGAHSSVPFTQEVFLTNCSASSVRKDESSSSDEENQSTKQTSGSSPSDPFVTPAGGISYKKTLRLTSEQLMSLQLKEGPNDVVFSVTTQYQGTCRCEGTIYLWSWDDKIVISDIDGTITRSDTLGHILPTLGKDWTHQGIARLYHKVSQNGYKFLYCSARAIGMADMTRGYLHWVNERGTMLPLGPVLLSPSSLFSALHREVIEKKPEKFKIECLTDIKNLFHPNTEPFYAAFGNRPTDVYSYKEVGVPLNRIFTVNPKGELVQEHAKTNISSYVRLSEVVDHVFPLLRRGDSSDFPCSDTFSQFTYWREQLPEVENQDENLELITKES